MFLTRKYSGGSLWKRREEKRREEKRRENAISNLGLESKSAKDTYIDELSKILPQVVTESKTKDGQLKKVIDFEKLKTILGDEIATTRDVYDFSWVGKKEAIRETGRVTTNTLRPDLEESVDFDNSGNVFISGDNLEVLKILQESYLNKIDMIYIDPPYNTGKDFVYSDKFEQSSKEWDEVTERIDEEGLVRVGNQKNTKESGRFHSNWLNMMYPRLALARNLLKESGVIFISIDDNEQANLKQLCDEIFGEENFVGNFIRRTINSGKQDSVKVSVYHEYALVYAKEIGLVSLNRRSKSEEERKKLYPLEDDYLSTRGRHYISQLDKGSLQYSDSLNYPIEAPDGTEIWPGEGFDDKTKVFRWSKEKVKWGIENDYVVFKKQGNKWKVYAKSYEYRDNSDNIIDPSNPYTTLDYITKEYSNFTSSPELSKLFDGKKYFDFPKPTFFIKDILKYSTQADSLILDFFAGSGTTADAVMQLNAEDGGNRKYIVCTLDEEVNEKSAAKEAGYETIDQISRERIRRAAAKIKEENLDKAESLDLGFKAYKVATSNYTNVYKTTEDYDQASLLDSISSIKEGRSELDLLYQVMLSWGLELSEKITREEIQGTSIYTVGKNELVACFAENLTDEVIENIAKRKVNKAVFRDDSFVNSSAKINLGEIFKEHSPLTKVKVV